MYMTTHSNLLRLLVFFITINYMESCIKLLNNWKPISLEKRTKGADLVVTGKIVATAPIAGQLLFYTASFEVLNVLKGMDILQTMNERQSKSLVKIDNDKVILSAKGFGDSRLCFSNVEVGESYALFLGYRKDVNELVAKYDDIFGAAELLYKNTEMEILESLGWENWTSWSKCDKHCGTGTQARTRKCLKTTGEKCTGSGDQKRNCNTYDCKDSINLLPLILEYESHGDPWKPRGESFDNQLEKRAAAKAPTHLFFSDDFPRDSVLHMSFHGPVKDTQYIYSIYNAEHQMKMGIKLSPDSIDFVYENSVDHTSSKRQSRRFPHEFTDNIWYTMALLLKDTEVQININCEHVYAASLNGNLFRNFDIFGHMYIGADRSAGSQHEVKVEIGQITLVKDPKSFQKQCGKVEMQREIGAHPTTPPDFVSSGEGPVSGPDDSEGGDVDEEYGSGMLEVQTKAPEECRCYNGGVCQSNGNCLCPMGWSGKNCLNAICKNKCLNDGNCTKPNTCTCKKGTSGKYCQFTECQLPCKNGGMCVGPNKCQCREGFEGQQCQLKTCLTKCENGGICTELNKCRCQPGFKGDKCQYRETCKTYVTKLVSYLKPALVYKYITVVEPCKQDSKKNCRTKKLKRGTINKVHYRSEYICKTQLDES